MDFTDDELRYLIGDRRGGPCLELTAWFASTPSFSNVGDRLCAPPGAFGPTGGASMLEEMRRGQQPSRSVLPSDSRGCLVVLELEGHGLGKIVVDVVQCEDPESPELERAIHAWLHPTIASQALGFGDLYADDNTFPWSPWLDTEAARIMQPVYRALIRWWSRLAHEPECLGLFVGYEGYEEGEQLAERYAQQRPQHVIVDLDIARALGWSGWGALDDSGYAAVPLSTVPVAPS